MRLVHTKPSGDESLTTRTLARNVDVADSTLSRVRGLMFRRSIPDDYALVFQFDTAETRNVHMLFVPFPIDVLWLVDGEVVHAERLRPWVGLGRGTADTLVELPAGAATDVELGDVVRVESDR
ncbi:DUF192 domain-containing protein [Haloarchaeobius sp. HRN-SO-5]|uniref:DUF192 domain-containing protein n=1 Tax=Haloarchaeobius sp. HRN-SO-5 TaxID=3446118 RepID=UPI003EB6D60A